MALPNRETVTFRDAAIIFKNFAGESRKFNPEGTRNFSIMIGEQQAADLERQGWNVKPLKRREEDDEQYYHLKVAVNFSNRPPRCWLISSGGRTMIGEGMVGMFDQLDSIKVDLTITPYDWKLDSGASGRKAYLQSFFFHMYEDELELEYADMPQLSAAGEGPRELEPGSRLGYDFEGEVVEDDER
jgi:hypothetical protein